MVRHYSIDESLVSLAVKASGDRPVDEVLSDALTEYARRRIPSTPSATPERQHAIQQWIEEGAAIPPADSPPTTSAQSPQSAAPDLLPILVEKYRRQGLVL